MYFDPKMTLEEYEDYKLQDEINIGTDFTDEYEDYEETDLFDDESYIDGLLTDGRSDDYQTGRFECDASEMFGEEVIGYSLY